MTLWEFAAMAVHLPPESATFRGIYGAESTEWGLAEHLLAEIADASAWLVWSKSKDAERNRNKPKPIPRPGVKPDESETRHFGSDPIPLDELDHFLGWSAEMAGAAPLADPPQPRDSRGRFMRRP